jgi:DNA-binding NarL/FixJ family response regulator
VDPVTVACQASDPVSAAGLAESLSSRPELVVLPRTPHVEADVLLVSLERLATGEMNGLRTLGASTRSPIVLVTGEIAAHQVLAVVTIGVVVVLERDSVTVEQIVQGVMTAARGSGALPAQVLGALLQQLQRGALAGTKATEFSSRELDVLRLMAEGLDTATIAAKLNYSERSVKNVIQGLTQRHQLRNRVHAVSYALRVGAI